MGSNRLRVSLGTLALRLYWALAGKVQQIPAMAFLYLQVFTPFFTRPYFFFSLRRVVFFSHPPRGTVFLYVVYTPTNGQRRRNGFPTSVALSFFSLQRATHGGSSVRPCSEMLNLAEVSNIRPCSDRSSFQMEPHGVGGPLYMAWVFFC